MSEKLCTLSTNDKVYFYDKSIVIFFEGKRRVLSTSSYNGGYHDNFDAVYNYDGKQGSGMPCEMLADTYEEHMRLISKRLALNPDRVSGMSTAASMENAVIESLSYKELTVTAIVTAGIETNGGRVGDPADYYSPIEKPDRFGTINIILVFNCDMPAGTMARALVTCTEAKTAAIQELLAGSNYSTGLATGSGTDQTIIIANPESKLCFEGAGKHSKMGELIGKVVIKAVKVALNKQSGLNPEYQHNAFRRMKRFGITPGTMWKLYSEITGAKVKPVYLVEAEKLATADKMLTTTSLYIHLIDQLQWKLINEEEAREAGNMLLKHLSHSYSVEDVELTRADIDEMTAVWCRLFNMIVASTLEEAGVAEGDLSVKAD